jgi:hypothetical protein
MDILNHSEITLRQAGYVTWPWSGGRVPVLCFENLSLIGFLHAFPSAQSLVSGWEEAQKAALARFAPALKLSGAKAWNVYSVFLTEEMAPTLAKPIERIEEDFSLTRKISRSGVKSAADLQQALLTLLPILSQPTLDQADFNQRLRARLKDLSPTAVTAFIGTGKPRDIVEILEESP